MRSGRSVDKLPSNPHSVSGLPDAAFEDVAHTKLSSHLLHIYSPTLVGEAGVSGDYEEPAHPRQGSDDLLNDPIREILLIAVATQVVKWQNGDGRLAG